MSCLLKLLSGYVLQFFVPPIFIRIRTPRSQDFYQISERGFEKDDYDELVKFDDIEKKLQKGHYRSSKRSYNIVHHNF